MRLVTWNVNSLKVRLPRVLQFLEEHAPDVLCLQETKCEAAAFPHEELAQAGYRAVDHSGGRWAGVAVLAREGLPLSDPSTGLPGEPGAEEARWVEATVDGIRVVSVYIPNGRELESEWYAAKLAFFTAAANRVKTLAAATPLVVAGDMNVAPTDLDVYDPAAFATTTHTSAPERAALQSLCDAGQLADPFRHLHPDEPGYTWWDYRAGNFHKGLGLRIDLTLLSPTLAERVTRCGIERPYRKGTKPSDHAPLVVEWGG